MDTFFNMPLVLFHFILCLSQGQVLRKTRDYLIVTQKNHKAFFTFFFVTTEWGLGNVVNYSLLKANNNNKQTLQHIFYVRNFLLIT